MARTEQQSNEKYSGRWFWRYASPGTFYPLAGKIQKVSWLIASVLTVIGLYLGLFLAPVDAQQGEAYRVIFIHVPAAWMAIVLYMAMAFWSATGLVLGTRLSFIMSHAIAPTGALMTVVLLVTGSLWGRATWGTYWAWDAKMTSSLILLFLYFGYMALAAAFDDKKKGDRASALIALVGVVNVPIIYFSAVWWNSLHQGPSVVRAGGPSMAATMLAPMLILTFAFWAYCIGAAMYRVRTYIIEREREAAWLQETVK